MFRRDLLLTMLATAPFRWFRPWVRPTLESPGTKEANAALIYQKALGWSKGLSLEDLERLRKAATIPIDDPNVAALIQKAKLALEAIREAASIGVCRWQPENILNIDDLLKGRLDFSNLNTIRVACLSARQLAKLHRGRDALDDEFAGLTLAHRIGKGGLHMARVLECGGEASVFQTLGRILPDLDRATLDDLSRRLELLPPPEPASAMIGPESRFILGHLRSKLGAIGPIIEDNQWSEIGFDAEDAATLKRLTGGDRARLLAHLGATGPAFDELARRLDLPRPDCRASLDQFAKTEQSSQPIVAGLVESAWGVRHVADRMLALRSMLRAGLVLVRDGEPAFLKIPDPYGTGAFALERRGKCTLIRSSLVDEGKPEVSLEVGEAA